MNFAEFKERYRRLIPYMTYYVANNYVNSQVLRGAQTQQGYEGETVLPTDPFIRKPQRLVPVGRTSDPRSKPNGHRILNGGGDTLDKQKTKFVPSVQYDPKDVGGDIDYFAPVGYNTKLNYDTMEYSGSGIASQYRDERPQQRPMTNPEMTSSATGIVNHDTRYYLSDRPSSRPHDPLYGIKYLPHKTSTPVADLHQDYLLNYDTKTSSDKAPIGGTDYSYPPDNLEPVRYLNIKPPSRHYSKPTRILAQSLSRRPLLQAPVPIYSIGHRPSASLNDIMKSLQLTNRLPEMLNKNNIDSSIKTLVEILGILNNAKQMDFSRLPITSTPLHRNVPSYDNFKQIHTRPTVVTETRFQATPSPFVIPAEKTLHYKPEATYEMDIRHKIRVDPNYENVNDEKDENVIEYYTPLVQDIDEKKIDTTYKPTERPINVVKESEQRYEIHEDFADDILEQQEEEQYALPMPTERPIGKFQLPDGASTNQQLGPPTTLKYGATRGKPNVDYPAHATIPETTFNCKEQRYKGFFGDPSTGCQVWHYCDLNGGKSSFLCPNGTIFSQVALTCDWWFNVKCESTTQLYVLNERLYKYILPIMPKFPEDFSGPEVDRYLELKFKEMEAKLKEKKLKKQQEKEKIKEKLRGLESKK